MSDDPHVHLEADAGRDSFSAARDVHVHQAPPSSAPAKREVWGNVPARNPSFTGRESLLTAIHDALASGGRAAVQALHGMGGVGKTQLAIEYAHRHWIDYDIVWWLNSETVALLGEQFAALAAELSCAAPDAPLGVMRRAVLATLHDRDRWLLIFDNAEKAEDIAGWLPGGTGHVLITSRSYAWHEFAKPVEVDVLARAESMAMLRDRVHGLSEGDAEKVAEALGDLPLAVAQAGMFMADTDMPASEYVEELQNRAAEILDVGRPPTYPASLNAVTRLAFERLRDRDLSAAQVTETCAFLAPEPIPIDWFRRAAKQLPEPLRDQAADSIAWRQLIGRLRGSSLVRVGDGTLLVHRLTQAIIREHLSHDESTCSRTSAGKVLTENRPSDEELPANWPAWGRMLPHVLALEPTTWDDSALRSLALCGTWYLIQRGDPDAAVDLARPLNDRWQILLGEDHIDTLWSAEYLASALYGLRQFGEARDLHKDTLERRRRVLGEDDRDTLWSASNLAADLYALGELDAARDLHKDTLERRRRVLGEDHPCTLGTANSLAADLYALGELDAARDLFKDTLERRGRVLGEDHLDTQESARNLAEVLRALGEE